jgi:hypothetical protein
VYVAEGVRGEVTAVARRGAAAYAFYRGKTYVGTPPAANAPAAPAQQPAPQGAPQTGKPGLQSLDENLKALNSSNASRQVERLQNRYQQGGQGGAAAKGFK